MITIVDYGMGNLGSIRNTLDRLDIDAKISSYPKDLKDAEKIILPGVGHFKKGMENLKKMDLLHPLNEKVLDEKTPILGICLGMQLFSKRSDEGNVDGLGWIDSEITKFDFNTVENSSKLKIPHMGWNSIKKKSNSSIIENVTGDDRFYFVHSYHYSNILDEDVIGMTKYGYEFPSIVQKGNIIGMQCHPERSHKSGLKILRNFERI